MDLELQLQRIGLGKQEASVYLASLKLGLAKASEIAQKSRIKREACYYVLNSLQEKGFISEVIKSGVKHYSAIQPKRILEIIEEEKDEKKQTINEILNELDSLQQSALTHPKIEIYESIEGLKNVFSLLIQQKNQIICSYVPSNIIELLPFFSLQFRHKRKENNVYLKVITEESTITKELKKKDKEELREIRFNDSIVKGMNTAIYIQERALIIIKANKKEQIGIYINQEDIAKLQCKIFDKIWKESS
ncbi:hypothetical protein J4423_02730 [Candidatus Pacearchaeota archaeon]|nr:hypothetical protein [Candidatus Pacearchaeota archaeon]